jgi:hypothetical protein
MKYIWIGVASTLNPFIEKTVQNGVNIVRDQNVLDMKGPPPTTSIGPQPEFVTSKISNVLP